MSVSLRVLILEDYPPDAELMVHTLRRDGFELDWTQVDDEAGYLAQLEAGPDVILSDYTLPFFDAMQALRLLQARGLDIPFIVVTGTISEEAAVECMKQGAADYILKDRMMRLGSAVRRALEEQGLRRQNRQAEQALRSSEANYRLLAENASDLITRYSARGDCLYASPSSRALLGYAPEEMIGRSVYDFLHPDELALFALQPDAGDARLTLSHRSRRKDGDYVWLETAIHVIFDSVAGATQEVVAISRDITDRHLAEAAIRDLNAQLEQRVATLTALHETGLALSAQVDLSSLLQTIVERAARLVGASMGSLHLLQADTQSLKLAMGYGLARDEIDTPLALGHGVAGRVAQSGEPLIVDDYAKWEGRVSGDLPYRSVAGVPISWQGDVLGVINLADERPAHFRTPDVEIMRLFAAQAAVAIVNARQRSALERRVRESEALAVISRALSETLDLERVLRMIVDAAQQIIPVVERAVIHLLDDEDQVLRAAALTGVESVGRAESTMRPGEGVAGQVMALGETINVRDTEVDPRYLPRGDSQHLRSLLVAPVQTMTRRLGTISALSSAQGAFSQDDERLLTTLGLQAALAIENASLFQTAQQRLKEVNALYQVSRGITATLDLEEVLRRVVELLQENFGYYHVHVYLVDPDSGDLVVRQGTGLAGSEMKGSKHRLSPGDGIVGHVLETKQPFMTNHVDDVVFFMRNPLLPETQSELAVPLRLGEQVLGVLDIQARRPQEFDAHDLRLMTTVADQLAAAVQKALLHADLQTALRHEQTARTQLVQTEKLAAMGRLVASVAHELNNPLQAIQNALFLVRQEETLQAQAREDLQVALVETDRMAALISRLRETYRPTSVEQFQPESLNQLVVEVEKLLNTHLRHHGIAFEFQPAPDLPETPAIRDQIKQVILNLCLNAVEAMPGGGRLTMSTWAEPQAERVWLACADTGLGISAQDLPHIFDPFYTTKDSGTGLGLAITYDIVQKHQGEISVESGTGMGTTFKFWLPAAQPE